MTGGGEVIPDHQLLDELSTAVERAETFTEALQTTIQRICEETEWAYGEAWVPDDREVALEPSDAWHATMGALTEFRALSESMQFSPGEGLPGRVWMHREPEWVADVASEPQDSFVRAERAAEAGLHAALGLPIVASGRVVAVLVFLMAEAREENDRLVSLVSTLAVFGSLYAQKEQVAAVEEEHAELETTLERSPVGIALVTTEMEVTYLNPHAAGVLGLDTSAVRAWVSHPDEVGFVDQGGDPLPPGETPAQRVLRTKRTVYDEWLGVPDGSDGFLWLSVSAAPILDGSGSVDEVVVTFQDIGERVAEFRELEAQARRLDEFASVLSHDLRSPLSVAEGYLELARAEADNEPLEKVAAALERIEELIEDVLRLARAGRVVTDRESVYLPPVVESAWGFAGDEAATLVVEEGLGTVYADRSRLQELLENLFRNCLEHAGDEPENPEASSVTVSVVPTEEGFAVDDDGPGIPASERSRIFDAGYSGGEGTGLGLSIARNIAEAHGWTLRADESPAGGARFEIRTTVGD